MARRTIVITGASDGIGAVAARELADDDTTLVLVGRSASKLAKVATPLGASSHVADFAELDQVRDLAAKIQSEVGHIDVLLNNAGGTFSPKQRTRDGHEPNFQINHLAPFLLTNLIKDRLAGSLVVNTSSIGNLGGRIVLDDLDYRNRRASEFPAYATSKLMNILFTRGIQQRWADAGVVSAAVHPGPVASGFGRDSALVGIIYRTPLKRFASITPEQGATPLVMLANRGADPSINGVYFSRHKANGLESPQAHKQELIDGLWTRSLEFVGL